MDSSLEFKGTGLRVLGFMGGGLELGRLGSFGVFGLVILPGTFAGGAKSLVSELTEIPKAPKPQTLHSIPYTLNLNPVP